jgi:hypothetical protein
MEKKVITIEALRVEKQYRDFYLNPINKTMQLHIWFHGDSVDKVKIS